MVFWTPKLILQPPILVFKTPKFIYEIENWILGFNALWNWPPGRGIIRQTYRIWSIKKTTHSTHCLGPRTIRYIYSKILSVKIRGATYKWRHVNSNKPSPWPCNVTYKFLGDLCKLTTDKTYINAAILSLIQYND